MSSAARVPVGWRSLPIRRKGIVLVLVPLLVLAVGLGALAWTDAHMSAALERRGLAQEGERIALLLLGEIADAESAVRGYWLSGGRDSVFLAGYVDALREAPRLARELAALDAKPTRDARINALVRQRMANLSTLRSRPGTGQELGTAQVRAIVAEDQAIGERLRTELFAVVADAREAALAFGDERARYRGLQTLLWVLLAALVALGAATIWMVTGREAQRLQTVARNMSRLVDEEPLEHLAPASDEIGSLDARMREAAALLRAREQSQRQAQVQAEAASEAKSEFLSRMSHELRTPLTAVLGFAELLEMDELDAAQADSVRHIRGAGRHLLGLINEVLDISRIETGHLPLAIDPVEVAAALDDVLALVRPIADTRAITLEAQTAGDRPVLVQVDRQRFTQILLNLLSNAVKYNREGGSIVVRCHADQAVTRIAVSDTGPGIAPELLPRVFAPFDRLGAERSGVEGIGVGLALSQRLADAMGGRITVESALGQGSTFTLRLPSRGALESGAVPFSVTPTGQEGAAASLPAKSATVLYVEDSGENIELLRALVARRPNVELIATRQGRLAVELARAHRPDLVLLDLHLSDIDGETVLLRLREDPIAGAIPVVMLTAHVTSAQHSRLLACGARSYLSKPLESEWVFALLDWLGSEAAADGDAQDAITCVTVADAGADAGGSEAQG